MIRPARARDLAGLVALEAGFPEADRFDRRTWRRLMAGHTRTLVAEADGRLAGAAVLLFRARARVARLYSISVAPHGRGQGVGARLLAACEAEAAARGCVRLRLEVRASNARALRLYESAGYRVLARLESYYPDGEAALRMEKELIAPSDEVT